MGYRTYIGYISKKEYDKIKSFNKEKLRVYKKRKKDDDYVGAYEIVKDLYNFGKYTEFDDEKFYKPFWKSKRMQNAYEGDFWIVEKDFLKHIIDYYTKKVKSFYEEMVNPFFDGRNPKEFLNSIKSEDDGDFNYKYKFDFSKITDEEQTAFFKILEHIRSIGNEYGVQSFPHMLPYNLEKGDEVTSSWKYEYSIFELVRIYKTFDWKKNIMVYYGW